MRLETITDNGDHSVATNTTQEEDTIFPKERYVVDCIADHVKTPKGTKYIIRWFVYDGNNDTVEPAEHIP